MLLDVVDVLARLEDRLDLSEDILLDDLLLLRVRKHPKVTLDARLRTGNHLAVLSDGQHGVDAHPSRVELVGAPLVEDGGRLPDAVLVLGLVRVDVVDLEAKLELFVVVDDARRVGVEPELSLATVRREEDELDEVAICLHGVAVSFATPEKR